MSLLYDDFTAELFRLFMKMLPLYVPKAHERAGTKVQAKSDGTPVTDLDNHALGKLRKLVFWFFPDDFTIGEEDKRNPEELATIVARDDQFQWTIDGLDGTWHFARRSNSYGAMISRRRGNEILYAAIFRPVDAALSDTGRFVTFGGLGAWEWGNTCRDTHRLRTAKPDGLERPVVLLEGSSKMFFEEPIVSLGKKITTRASLSSSIAATIVASGNASAIVTVGNKPWDNWPMIGLIEGAGGIVTDWMGNPRRLDDCGNIVAAANEQDLNMILKLLNS